MLLNSFFSIIETQNEQDKSESFISKIELDATHNIFKGHFPAEPVVPGVCLLQMAKEIAEVHLQTHLTFVKSPGVKYLSIVNPLVNNIIEYRIQLSPTENYIQADITAINNDSVCLKTKVMYQMQ